MGQFIRCFGADISALAVVAVWLLIVLLSFPPRAIFNVPLYGLAIDVINLVLTAAFSDGWWALLLVYGGISVGLIAASRQKFVVGTALVFLPFVVLFFGTLSLFMQQREHARETIPSGTYLLTVTTTLDGDLYFFYRCDGLLCRRLHATGTQPRDSGSLVRDGDSVVLLLDGEASFRAP